MLFLYAPTCYRRGEKQKNICMFITFKRMDGFFETAHLKRTSVYYKRRKEKCIKKNRKNILSLHPQSVYFPIPSFLLHGETFWSIVTYEKAAKYQVMTSLKIPRLLNTFFFLSPLFYSFYPILFFFLYLFFISNAVSSFLCIYGLFGLFCTMVSKELLFL